MGLWKQSKILPDVLESRVEQYTATLRLRLDEDLFQFQGHFPGNPVAPGVAQVDWAVQFGNIYLNTSSTVREVSKLKFCRLSKPGDNFSITLSFDAESARLNFAFAEGNKPVSSGVIHLGEP